MNNGLLLFFGIVVAMVSSWFGFVHSPQLQFGTLVPEVDEASGATFPSPRSGAAIRGLDIYRQNGCASCHTQQVRQEGYDFTVEISDYGDNTDQVAELLATYSSNYEAGSELPALPFNVVEGVDLGTANRIVKKISATEAAVMAQIVPHGPDIERGWGIRRTVGADYLLDKPVMLGNQRIGPDLANIGNRNPDANWHYVHLFQPRKAVEDSVMPSYPFLFDRIPVNGKPDVKALRLKGELVTDAEGRQIIPRAAAKDLVAYLLSLRLDTTLFEAPGLVVASDEESEATDVEDEAASQ